MREAFSAGPQPSDDLVQRAAAAQVHVPACGELRPESRAGASWLARGAERFGVPRQARGEPAVLVPFLELGAFLRSQLPAPAPAAPKLLRLPSQLAIVCAPDAPDARRRLRLPRDTVLFRRAAAPPAAAEERVCASARVRALGSVRWLEVDSPHHEVYGEIEAKRTMALPQLVPGAEAAYVPHSGKTLPAMLVLTLPPLAQASLGLPDRDVYYVAEA